MFDGRLETFIKVAECGSFTKAADDLYITPTAVMKQINALEKELEVTLFDRSNHGLRITKAGEAFLQDARYILEYITRAEQKAREIQEGETRRSIRIGTSVMTPAKFILDVWSQIQSRMPTLKIELIPFENNPVNSVEILRNLGQHIDVVAGLYDDNFLQERRCLAAHMYNKRILLAVPVSHALSAESLITPEKLKNRKVLFIRRGWNIYVDDLRDKLEASGVRTEDFEMFNISAYNRAVTENKPIITVEGWEDVHPLLKLIPVDWEDSIPFGVFYSPTPTKLVKRFVDLLGSIAVR
ncbi:MAG TPA: LysR family transcriptional regulator [Firmicutes bacterium]|nr:LysR family transcriptional regulator [Bacillota bacterium]